MTCRALMTNLEFLGGLVWCLGHLKPRFEGWGGKGRRGKGTAEGWRCSGICDKKTFNPRLRKQLGTGWEPGGSQQLISANSDKSAMWEEQRRCSRISPLPSPPCSCFEVQEIWGGLWRWPGRLCHTWGVTAPDASSEHLPERARCFYSFPRC